METVPQDRPYLTGLIEQDAKRKKRRAKVKKLIERQITWTVMNFLSAWMFMLAVGVAHAVWIRSLPTLGYWWSLLLVYLLRAAFVPYASGKTGGAS